MRLPTLPLVLSLLALGACGKPPSQPTEAPPRFVKTVTVSAGSASTLGLSGIVRARVESPLAFQVGGRIADRLADAGQKVQAGQVIFVLDKRDLDQAVRAAEADLAAAEASVTTAQADLDRNRELRQKNFVSAQALDRVQLLLREAQTRRDAAAARLAQARNALGYGNLVAPASGVLVDVTGERGQVVPAGQPVAILAQAGDRELEVHFPEGMRPPATGESALADGTMLPLKLRETSGAVDPQGRTLRARYTVLSHQDDLVLGAVLRARFEVQAVKEAEFSVPIAAINERGEGARVWRVQNGEVTAVPVVVSGSDGETARIRGDLHAGDRIVVLGTHLLRENMKVRELGR